MKHLYSIFAFFLVLTACNVQEIAEDTTSNDESAEQERYLHEPNLQSLVMRVINKNGYGYDPEYTQYISKPSPWYSDFFGLQAIKTLDKETIQTDFVPEHANLLSADSNQLTLDFKAAGKVTFFINTSLVVRGLEIPIDHVSFEGESWQEFTGNIEAFMGILQKDALEEKYLIPNPNYDLEKIIYRRLNENMEASPIMANKDLSAFSSQENGILIFPDLVHGDSVRFNALRKLVSEVEFDWIGLEMLSDEHQETIDVFLSAEESSAAFQEANAKLTEIYHTSWVINTTEKDPWINLFKILKERKKKAYGMEPSNLAYLIFRFGETDFGGAVRNIIWASNIPTKGRGIVFGGKNHFNHPKAIDFQDFAKERNDAYQFFSLEEIKDRN